ncbi:MAG: hypothetical protein FWH18_07970 [Marinilabiliaceae bacterium]|nr:hypothetical protein [Marinilabiliaceae bacterium]
MEKLLYGQPLRLPLIYGEIIVGATLAVAQNNTNWPPEITRGDCPKIKMAKARQPRIKTTRQPQTKRARTSLAPTYYTR